MNAPAIIAVHHLPSLIDRAANALTSARTSAEVLEARDMASFAYDAAKRSARLSKAKSAHDDVIAAAFRVQADALEIEAQAKRRLADEYDAAQERGEVQGHGGQGKRDVPSENIPSVSDIGLTRKAIHEARQLRDAEIADPGVIRRALNERLESGEEPSRAAVRRAIVEASERGLRPERKPTRINPHYEPSPLFDATAGVSGSCRRILEFVEKHGASQILSGCVDDGMRVRTIATLTKCRDTLTEILEIADAEDARA